MERRIPMKRRVFLLAGLLLLVNSSFGRDSARRQLVLVAAGRATIPAMSHGDVRRAYLGLRDSSGSQRSVPLGNRSDPLLYEVFLQKVIFMSARNYERQILSHVYQSGNQRLVMYENKDDVVKHLSNDSDAISYMWASDIKIDSGLRIVQVIWEGNVE